MARIHLFICVTLFLFFSVTSACIAQCNLEITPKERLKQLIQTPDKIVGRASLSIANKKINNSLNIQLPVDSSRERQRGQLSGDEKQLLRRQINDAESKYPQQRR